MYEHHVACLEGRAEPGRRQRRELALTVLAHIGQRLVGVHVEQRPQLRVVDPDVRDHGVHARLQPIDERDQTVRLPIRRREILRRVHRLPEVARHPQPIFLGQPLRHVAEFRIARGGTHVLVDVIDLHAGTQRALDLRPQFLLDFGDWWVVLVQGFGGGKEKAVLIDQRRNGGTARDRTPPVVPPLRIQREMDADGDVGMSLQNLHRFLIPRAHEQHRHRHRHAGRDEFLHRHVDAVTHADVVGADEQRNSRGHRGLRRHERPRASWQQPAEQGDGSD